MIDNRVFSDRRDAGRELARHLAQYAGTPDLLVVALPRGGVPVGYEVARALHAALDVFVVRKLGYPAHEELAVGAVASGGMVVFDPNLVADLSKAEIDAVVRRGLSELTRREAAYRRFKPSEDLRGKTVILVDDGLATGSTMYAAVRSARTLGPKRIVVAVPVAPQHAVDALRAQADDVVAALVPTAFYAVGQYYEDFTQTTDEEVETLLKSAMAETRR